jgi:fructose-bisphosphate aldolase class 1
MDIKELDTNAAAMVARGKGILAADESTGTIKKRFDKIGLESTFETRRAYRELLFTAPEAEKYISGVILYDETIRQQTAEGKPFPQLLAARGILPGIKVDAGAKPLAGFPGETVTEGLDGLRERLAEYRGLGARFAKWRAVIDIGGGIPTLACLAANAEALARYAALCQEASIVPIVEPEVLMDGDHGIERCGRSRMRPSNPCSTRCFATACASRAWSSSRTWSSPGRNARSRPHPRRSPRRRCAACAVTCPQPCPASPSCPAARARPTRRCTCR